MEKNSKLRKQSFLFLVSLIGIISAGAAIFGFYEASFFNTYLEHILDLDYIYISIMVSVSATFGLVFILVFGILSDNTRSKYGRRRPFLLFGIIAGLSMFLFAFSPNFIWCFILDSIIIGIASNAFYTAQRVLIPDLIEIERRGRANGIVQIFTLIGTVLPVGLTLLINEFYTIQTGNGSIISQNGYIISLAFGGFFLIIVSILGFLLIKEKPISELPPKKRFFEDLKESFQYEELRANKDLFLIIIALTIFNIGIRMILPFAFNYFFSLGLPTLGLILGMSIILPVSLILMLFLGKIADKYGRKRFLTPIILVSSIGFVIIPFFFPNTVINSIIYIIAVILILIALIGILIPLNAWQHDLLPESKRGQFIGILNIINTVSQIPGAIFGGLIADAFGIKWIFIFVPIFLIGAIPFFMMVKETLPNKIEDHV
jgi:maltose/moltooligosaccharide transporter